MVEQFESLKEAILKSEKQFSGGRAEIARLMGLTYDSYRNRLREDREDQQFSASQLEDIQFITGTSFIAQYFANKAGQMIIPLPIADIDSEELSEIQMIEAAAIGSLSVTIAKAVEDGVIDEQEAKLINQETLNAVAKIFGKSQATIRLYKAG